MVSTKTALSRVLFVVYLLAIAVLCFASFGSMSSISKEIAGVPTDKVVHFIMFLPFPILSYLSFDHQGKKWWKSLLFVLASLGVGCLVAWGTELVQGQLSYRSKDLHDFYADSLALCLSSIIVLISDLRRKK